MTSKDSNKHSGTGILRFKHIGMQIVAGGSAGCVEVIINVLKSHVCNNINCIIVNIRFL